MALNVIATGTIIPVKIGIQVGARAILLGSDYSLIALSIPIRIVHVVIATKPIIW